MHTRVYVISDSVKYYKVKSGVRSQAMIWVGGVLFHVGWSGEFSVRILHLNRGQIKWKKETCEYMKEEDSRGESML